MRLSTQALALASARRPRRTLAAWCLAVVAGLGLTGAFLGGALSSDRHVTNEPQSIRAARTLATAFPAASRGLPRDVVIVSSGEYGADARAFRAKVLGLERDLRGVDGVSQVTSPYADGSRRLVSADRRAVLIGVDMDEDAVDDVTALLARADADPAFAVGATGDKTRTHDFNRLSQEDLQTGELQFGLPAALVVLLLVFGSVVAGVVPLLMAMFAIVVALGAAAVLAHAFELSIFVTNMLTGMGLALGIDYSLFVVSRYREERGRGLEKLDAIATAGATASRAVVVSGTTFLVAMLAMLIVPNSIMRSLAVGAILVAIVSVAAAVTLLPALLGLIGDGVDRLRLPLFGRGHDPEDRFWRRIVGGVLRRPAATLVASVVVLLAAAAPVVGMHIGTTGVTTLPEHFESRQGFAALERHFPSATTDPMSVVVADAPRPAAAERALARVRAAVARDPAFGPAEIRRSDSGVLELLVSVRGDPVGDAAIAAVRHARSDVVPSAFAGTGATVYVGGQTSESIDYFDSVTGPAPYVIGLVLALSLVLLTAVFRSLIVAATAVVLNLLSVAAAYGLLVLVFQHGVLADVFGFRRIDAIEAWVPLFLFSVLFGLSMDYQVFLLSRISERHARTGDTERAISFGVSSTARIITGAALIIVVVFVGFALGELVMFQQMGFGIAAALLIDATIVRSLLLPSTMALLGRWNWYLPRSLRWLPRLRVEDAGGG